MSDLLSFIHAGPKEERLDRAILHKLEGSEGVPVSRSQIKRWIETGLVTVNGQPATKAGALLNRGDLIRIPRSTMEPEQSRLKPYPLELGILFEDEDLIVVNKPAGLTVHPGAGNREQTLINALVAHLGPAHALACPDRWPAGAQRPGVVHRLDKDTSGVLVVAKSTAVHAALSRQFANRTTGRSYFALALSTPRAAGALARAGEGTIEANIGRHSRNRKRMAVLKEGGRRAVTHWKVIEKMDHALLLDVRLETGRTHQVRVHMAHLGAPLIGDQLYGNFSSLPKKLEVAASRFGRQALHAYRLEFSHPRTDRRVEFRAPLPQDFVELLESFGGAVPSV